MIFNALKDPNNMDEFQDMIEQSTVFNDPLLMKHLGKVIGFLKSPDYKKQSLIEVSNIIKQTEPSVREKPKVDQISKLQHSMASQQQSDCEMRNFLLQSDKFQWAGIAFPNETKIHIYNSLVRIAKESKAKEIRFWGKILGRFRDYYIIQGVRNQPQSLDQIPSGHQKPGQGINFYSYWVTNDPADKWVELPTITPQHINVARQSKINLTGDLHHPINLYPAFKGVEKHYLKAQLCRMTHSLELAPKGIYKVHDENPKIVQYEEQAKVPEFAELNTIQTWTHKNSMILNLGRCSHYVDPSLPEDQIEALAAQLTEKDPECERLRGIIEDKLPQNLTATLNIQNIWTIKVEGDSQVFTKEDANLVYGVVTLRNLYWPGWITIGYKGGYSNIYVGRGLKAVQSGWSTYDNPDIQLDADDTEEFSQPNPKQLPKPLQQEPEDAGQANPDQ